MAELVYILCALTSVACAVLLVRGYRAARAPLLFWSALCFVTLAVHNVVLYLDMVTFAKGPDLTLLRTAIGAIAGLQLLYGLIRETAGGRYGRSAR